MEPIQLSGLGSGFDYRPVIDQLIALERIPQNRLRAEQSELENKSRIYDTLKSRMSSLQTAVNELDDEELFFGRKAALAGGSDSTFSVSVSDKTVTGNYEFNVTKLATNTTADGDTDVGSKLGGTSTALEDLNLATSVTDGTITINGAQIEVDSEGSLQDLFDDILAETTAAGDAVTASYDSVSDTITLSAASGGVILGSSTDTSNFFTATKLNSNTGGDATSSAALGGINFNAALDSGNTGLKNAITSDGSFFINGEEFTIDASADTVQDLIARVNESDAGITISYNSSDDRFTLQNNETGAIGMALDGNGSGFFTALGIDTSSINYTLGDNAEFTINGGSTLTSTSNVLTADVHGITGLDLTATELGTETVSVTADSSPGRKKIDNFISTFNSVQSYLDLQTRITVSDDDVTAGVLAGNSDVSQLISKLRTVAFGTVSSLDGGDVKRLADIGIDFISGTNQLEVTDSAALNEALEKESAAITTLFSDEDEGLVAQMDELLKSYVDDDGTIDTLNETIDKQVSNIDNQIDVLERLIQQRSDAMEASFLAMEQAQAEINRQAQILNSSFS